MRSIIRATVFLAATGVLFACKPKPEPVEVAEQEDTAEQVDETPAAEMIEACRLALTEPEQHDWTTYWDTSAVLANGESPSSVHSIYWSSPEETTELIRSKSAVTLTLRCTSAGPPSITMSLAALGASTRDVPMSAGDYQVVGNAQELQPGQFLAATVSLDQRTFIPSGGSLTIDRFDMEGVRGSFRIEGKESGDDGVEFRLSGDFNMPCRGGAMESLCEARSTAAQ
jgi:hypothetical protein